MLFDIGKSKKAAKVSGPVKLDEAMWDRLGMLYDAGVKRLPDAASWYDDTFSNIQSLFEMDDSGEDSEALTYLFIDLLAATSPQTNIIRNTFLATQMFAFINDAILCKIKMAFEAHLNNVCRALLGLPLSGQKVTAFQANLLGDQNAVTVDLWMMRVFQRDNEAPTPAEYEDISKATRKAAKEFGVSPAQMQAALWVGIKAMEGDPSDTPEPFEKTLDRFKARQDAQGALDFAHAESKFKDTEAALAADRALASNPGEGFTSPRVIGDRMKEIVDAETNADSALVNLICRQPSGALMGALLFTRSHMPRWAKGGGQPVRALEEFLEREFDA